MMKLVKPPNERGMSTCQVVTLKYVQYKNSIHFSFFLSRAPFPLLLILLILFVCLDFTTCMLNSFLAFT